MIPNANYLVNQEQNVVSKYKGRTVSSKSDYDDDVWDLNEYSKLGVYSDSALKIDFSSYNSVPLMKDSLKDYAFSRMFDPVMSYRTVTAIVVCYEINVVFKKLCSFLCEIGIQSFYEVDHEIIKRYSKNLHSLYDELSKDEFCCKQQIRKHVNCVKHLYAFRNKMIHGVHFDPFGGQGIDSIVVCESVDENRTTPIPESIYYPIIYNAMYILENYSHIVLVLLVRIRELFLNRRTVKPNHHLAQKCMAETAKEFILNKSIISFNGEKIYITEEMKNVAKKMHNRWKGISDYMLDLALLRNACLTSITALSAMRTSELLLLENHCCALHANESGVEKYKIHGTLVKNKGNRGQNQTWGTVKEVYFSICCLEEINRIFYDQNKTKMLLIPSLKKCTGAYPISESVSHIDPETLTYSLNQFRTNINYYVETGDLDVPIPLDDDDGNQYKLNARCFRRTLARYIAREPYGIIAGMLHYKHLSVAIFEGYAGTDNEWLMELEEEQSIASVDILDEIALDLASGELGGQGGIALC